MFRFFNRKKNGSGEDLKNLIKSIHSQTNYVYSPNDLKNIREYNKLKTLPEEKLKVLILNLIDHYTELKVNKAKFKGSYQYDNKIYMHYADNIVEAVIAGLMRRKLNYNQDEWIELFERFRILKNEIAKFPNFYFNLSLMPINHSIKQIEYNLKENSISPKLRHYINGLIQWDDFNNTEVGSYYGSDLNKASKKLKSLVNTDQEYHSFELKSNDIGDAINKEIRGIANKKENFYKIFLLAADVSGSKPSGKFTKVLNRQLDTIGLDLYRRTVHKLLKLPIDFKPYSKTTIHEWQGNTYEHTQTLFLSNPSQNFIKGLVWTCGRFSDKETISLLIRLAEKCYTKIPGKGPAAASIGNACVHILGNMKGKDGLGALSRLKIKVRQNNVKKSIDKLLSEGAKKYNVSVEELKEMAVPEFGMKAGSKHINFEDHKLNVFVSGSKVAQQWIKPDGSLIKGVPSKVRNTTSLKIKLQNVRKELKEVQKAFSAQKQRIDNQFILDRVWDYPSFKKYYLDHGLVYPITSKLIWSFTNERRETDAIIIDGQWRSIENETVDWLDNNSKVKLWHPVNAEENTIIRWRKKILDLEWKQPIKQAYREIYILTDAEINTKSYSNRMAAHILKQHQFNSLANLRDWKYALMGAYDDGRYNEICSKLLPEYGIKAEFWIDELNQDDAFNETGIWLYVKTDQVKFKDLKDVTLDLIDVPKMVFSEIMRDVDLFVGVSSVGNDPEWMDNNGERQSNRDYWQSYSFGDLNEIAKTRKEILMNLLPRLKKIRNKAKIEGKFLIVKGQLRTYKIHIGSGNILMEPNDQYLCIVPSRTTDKATNNLFIPFEGDRGLSIVLSKAFLLAEDEKIEDSTITSQINRNIN